MYKQLGEESPGNASTPLTTSHIQRKRCCPIRAAPAERGVAIFTINPRGYLLFLAAQQLLSAYSTHKRNRLNTYVNSFLLRCVCCEPYLICIESRLPKRFLSVVATISWQRTMVSTSCSSSSEPRELPCLVSWLMMIKEVSGFSL